MLGGHQVNGHQVISKVSPKSEPLSYNVSVPPTMSVFEQPISKKKKQCHLQSKEVLPPGHTAGLAGKWKCLTDRQDPDLHHEQRQTACCGELDPGERN